MAKRMPLMIQPEMPATKDTMLIIFAVREAD